MENCMFCGNSMNFVRYEMSNKRIQIKENFNDLISVCKDCHEKIHFEGSVFFKGLKANFGVLNFCQHCKQYHQDGISILCNICKTKNHA